MKRILLRFGALKRARLGRLALGLLLIASLFSLSASAQTWDFKAGYLIRGTSTMVTNDFRIWLPSGESVIRGVILLGPGSSGDWRGMVTDPAAQQGARAMGFGLIGYQNAYFGYNIDKNNVTGCTNMIQVVLNAAAATCGRPELVNAPLCITGYSAGGFDSCNLSLVWPERLIAFVAHRGKHSLAISGGQIDPPLSAATKKVPGLMIAGSLDGNALANPAQVHYTYQLVRSAGAQVAFAADWRIGHDAFGGQGWEACFAWFAEVGRLRYPRPTVPSTSPGAGWPTLLELADSSGWLGQHPVFIGSTTIASSSPCAPIVPYAQYGGPATNASWLPNETCARLFRALSSTDLLTTRTVQPRQTPLAIYDPGQYTNAFAAGTTVTIAVDPREFDDIHAVAQMQFYDGATLLGSDTSGPTWSYAFQPAAGLHTLNVLGIDTAGNTSTAFRVVSAIGAEGAALPYRESFEALAPNFPLPGYQSWTADEADAASVSTNAALLAGVLAYAAPVGLPLRREAHTRIASIVDSVVNYIDTPERTAVWGDLLIQLNRMEAGHPAITAEVRCSLCLDADGYLNVWHRDLDAGSNRWSTLAWHTAQTAQWARVTLQFDYATPDALHNARYFRVFIDGAVQSNALAWSANDGSGALGGDWFAMSAAVTPTRLNGLIFNGGCALDDLVVDTARPLIGIGPHGTPEWWLADHDLTNGNSLAANELEDADNDRFPNWKEREAFTDPNDPESLLRVTALAEPLANGRLPLTLQTIPGQRYTLQGTTNLVANLWEEVPFSLTPEDAPVIQTVAAEETTLLLYVAPDAPLRFYRVTLVP